MSRSRFPVFRSLRRYLLVGLLTAAPLWITWLVFDFLFTLLSRAGQPWVNALARFARKSFPVLANWLEQTWFQSLLAALIVLVGLCALGWVASRVLGQRLIAAAESLLERVPLVQAIYGGTKRFLAAVKQKPSGVQRVVLIDFPTPGMKAVGFVTRTMEDATSGSALAVVYVPTSPNPTSGYIEIVPLERVTPTDWTIDEAMSFVITGGTTAPDRIPYDLRRHGPESPDAGPRYG